MSERSSLCADARKTCEECANPLTDAERERGETFCFECWSVPEDGSIPSETAGLCLADPGSDV